MWRAGALPPRLPTATKVLRVHTQATNARCGPPSCNRAHRNCAINCTVSHHAESMGLPCMNNHELTQTCQLQRRTWACAVAMGTDRSLGGRPKEYGMPRHEEAEEEHQASRLAIALDDWMTGWSVLQCARPRCCHQTNVGSRRTNVASRRDAGRHRLRVDERGPFRSYPPPTVGGRSAGAPRACPRAQ